MKNRYIILLKTALLKRVSDWVMKANFKTRNSILQPDSKMTVWYDLIGFSFGSCLN